MEATDWVKCWKCGHHQIIPIRKKDDRCEKCDFFLFNNKRGFYGWREIGFHISDNKAVSIGTID